MKKIIILFFTLTIAFSAFQVSAEELETKTTELIVELNFIPDKMAPGSTIEFIDSEKFLILNGDIVPGFDVKPQINLEQYNEGIFENYPSPIKGMIITYADDGLILDIVYPNEKDNPYLNGSTELLTNIPTTAKTKEISSTANLPGGFTCGPLKFEYGWGSYPNNLYTCKYTEPICPSSEMYREEDKDNRLYCSTTTTLRVGKGRATTFSDVIGQQNIRLKKGDAATKLAFDNVTVGTLLNVETKQKTGSLKTIVLRKNDAGGMPNAVLDIWKTGVEYWGYSWTSTFSMPNVVQYTYRISTVSN